MGKRGQWNESKLEAACANIRVALNRWWSVLHGQRIVGKDGIFIQLALPYGWDV